MKKIATLAAALILLTAVACKQETHTTVDETGTSSTSTVSAEVPAVDTAAVNDAAADATAATETAARDAAHNTGTAMETAGQELQQEAKTDTK